MLLESSLGIFPLGRTLCWPNLLPIFGTGLDCFILSLLKVKSHTGNFGNDFVDEGANKGRNINYADLWFRKRCRLTDWGASDFLLSMADRREVLSTTDIVIDGIQGEIEQPDLKRARRIIKGNKRGQTNFSLMVGGFATLTTTTQTTSLTELTRRGNLFTAFRISRIS